MEGKISKWEISELSSAMANAIFHRADNRFIKQHGHTVKFNGFWRNGDKQNICAWLDKATWHDAKTGDGGSCKDFARVAFNMTLPEFMKEYGMSIDGPAGPIQTKTTTAKTPKLFDLNRLWKVLSDRDRDRTDHAATWLTDIRKFREPHRFIGSGFTNLSHDDVELFAHDHRSFVQSRIQQGRNIVVPLRGTQNEGVENLFIRNVDNVPKEERTRLLIGCGGWTSHDGNPRAFGFPHLVNQFPNVIICEGMADYFAAECLLDADEKYLPIGAPGTAAIEKWGSWLKQTSYTGNVHLVYQLDLDDNGRLDSYGPGQNAAVNAKRALRSVGISAHLFNWSLFLRHVEHWTAAPQDLADTFVCSGAPHDTLQKAFLNTLKDADRK